MWKCVFSKVLISQSHCVPLNSPQIKIWHPPPPIPKERKKHNKLGGLKCPLYLFCTAVNINISVCIKSGSVLKVAATVLKMRPHLLIVIFNVCGSSALESLSSATIPAKWCIRTCAACLYLSWLMGCFYVLLCAPMRNHCACGFDVRSAIPCDRLECTSWQCIHPLQQPPFHLINMIFFHTVTVMLWKICHRTRNML